MAYFAYLAMKSRTAHDVAEAHVDLPRRLLSARSRGRQAHGGAGSGDRRRLRHRFVSCGSCAPEPTSCSRDPTWVPNRSRGWATTAGPDGEDELPFLHTRITWARARAEPDDLVFAAAP